MDCSYLLSDGKPRGLCVGKPQKSASAFPPYVVLCVTNANIFVIFHLHLFSLVFSHLLRLRFIRRRISISIATSASVDLLLAPLKKKGRRGAWQEVAA